MLGVSQLLTGEVTEGDALRYGRHSGRLPAKLLHYSEDKKPVVVWKGGQTEAGARATMSHTGSLAAPQAIWEAMVRQELRDDPSLLE